MCPFYEHCLRAASASLRSNQKPLSPLRERGWGEGTSSLVPLSLPRFAPLSLSRGGERDEGGGCIAAHPLLGAAPTGRGRAGLTRFSRPVFCIGAHSVSGAFRAWIIPAAFGPA